MIQFQLVSSSGIQFDEEVYEVIVPTADGVIAVFEDHMPLLSAAVHGPLSVRRKASDRDSAMAHFAVIGGVVEIDNKRIRFVSDDVTDSEEISEKEAAEALARAQKLLGDADNQIALEQARHLLSRSTVHLQVAKLRSRRHN